MSIKKQYFYLPDNRSLVVLSEFFPVDNWAAQPGYMLSINTADGVIDLEFASKKGIKLLLDALHELFNTDQDDISIKAFMAKDYDVQF